MHKKISRDDKQGYLLIEVLISLFIFSIIIIPWLQFLKVYSLEKQQKEISLFFETKRIFLKALDENMAEIITQDEIAYQVEKGPLMEGSRALTVNCLRDERILYTLTGVCR